MSVYEVKDHAPSVLPEGEWDLVWSDEFDGTVLDESKWAYRLCMMNKVHPAWTDKGVTLDGKSNCVFTLLEEDGRPVCSQLQTGFNFMDTPVSETTFGNDHLQWNIGKLQENKATFTYGYFECRCRLQQKKGWWSAFWMQSPIIGCCLDPAVAGAEIDIMESFVPGMVGGHNVFAGGYGSDMQHRVAGGPPELAVEDYHLFGLKWDENGYTFYVDGKEDGHISELVSHRPEFLLISAEPHGYRHESHQPTEEAKAAIGDQFLVDHVRVFQKK